MKPFIVRDNADKTAEFGQITNDIQNLIADTQKDKYTAVVYKDEAFTTIIDTPEKYSNEIDDPKLKFLDELNEFVMTIQKKYENA